MMAIQDPTMIPAASLNPAAVETFRSQLRGQLIRPEDPDYDAARRVYNGMIDRRPALIARVADVADVISAVNFGRESGLAIAVRGGGHSGPGFGTNDGGLVIDLSCLRGIHVAPENRTVRVEAGCVWGEVDHATHPFGLAVPSGFVSSTGVGGLTLGGGVGYLTRRYGLTLDNLLAVDMVLADGRFVTASDSQNADLYWAVRGGGGNFGVVTSFLFRAHPVSTVYGGPMMWPMEEAAEVLKFWQKLILDAPEDMNGWFAFVTVPPAPPFPTEHHMEKMAAIVWCYTGPLDQAEAAFKPIREFRKPAIDLAGPIPWPILQGLFDALYPSGLQWYWRADFFKELDDRAIELEVKYGAQLPTMHSTMHIYPINGAAGRVGSEETAWSYRDANFSSVIVGVDPDPANNDRMIAWAKDYWLALHPYSSGGGYLNMTMDEGEDRVKAAYRNNYARLTRVKAAYDPQNLFRLNQNIKPAA
jgi:FAD/FMN-containing dehydrogenase